MTQYNAVHPERSGSIYVRVLHLFYRRFELARACQEDQSTRGRGCRIRAVLSGRSKRQIYRSSVAPPGKRKTRAIAPGEQVFSAFFDGEALRLLVKSTLLGGLRSHCAAVRRQSLPVHRCLKRSRPLSVRRTSLHGQRSYFYETTEV